MLCLLEESKRWDRKRGRERQIDRLSDREAHTHTHFQCGLRIIKL